MAVGESLPPRLTAVLRRWGVQFSWIAVAAVLPLAPFLADAPLALRYAPFVASVVVFGFPHGAVDHLVPDRLGDASRRRSLALVGVLYAVLGGLYTGWWFLAPVSAFGFFILLTWAHWGQGDLYALLRFVDADHLPTRAERALAAVVRGGLPMLVPLVAFPTAYREVAAALVGLFADQPLPPLFGPTAQTAVGLGFGAVSLLAVTLGGVRVVRGAARRPWLVDAGEVTLLWLYFLAVPPVLAIGLYFCFWHATRHLARLALIDDAPPDATPTGLTDALLGAGRGARTALASGDLGGALRKLARDATPMTVGGLVIVGLVLVAAPRAAAGAEGLLAVYLVGIAVLTLPHVAVVTWMDLRQGVW